MKQYYPSPLLRDYTTHKSLQYPKFYSQSKQNKKQHCQQTQKINNNLIPFKQFHNVGIKYNDGILVPSSNNQNIGMFYMHNNQYPDGHYGNSALILYHFQKVKSNAVKKSNNAKQKNSQISIRPHGRNYLLGNNGIRISANYACGNLSKWLIGYYPSKFIVCHNYRNKKKEGRQLFYDQEEQMLVISQYSNGNLVKIQNTLIGSFTFLVTDDDLISEINRLKNLDLDVPKQLQFVVINQFKYFGASYKELKTSKIIPNGFGVLQSDQQIYYGNFNQGCLSGIGYIRFPGEDYSYYYGDLDNGVSGGYGCYRFKQTVTYKFGNEQINKDKFDQYIKVNTVPEITENWLDRFSEMKKFQVYLYERIKNQLSANEKSIKKHLSTINKYDLVEDSNILEEISELNLESNNQNQFSQDLQKKNNQLWPQMSFQIKGPITPIPESKEKITNLKPVSAKKSHSHTNHSRDIPILSLNQKEDIRYEEIGLQPDYIAKQYNFGKPHQLVPKGNFTQRRKKEIEVKKNNKKVAINMGQIIRDQSESFSSAASSFIQKISHS